MSEKRLKVAVVGVGSVGSMALWQLAARGVDAVGYEQFWPGHDRGAAGGGTRMFRRAYAEGIEYAPIIDRAIALWRSLENATRTELLVRTGGLSIGNPTHPLISRTLASAQTSGVPYELLAPDNLAIRFPAHRLREDEIAMFDPEAGVVRSNASIAAAARAATALGARIHTTATVLAIEESPSGVLIRTPDTDELFDRVVVSPGPWSPTLLPEIGMPFEVRSTFHTWHLVHNPCLLLPDRFPSTMRRSTREASFGSMLSLDGQTIKFSPHTEYDGSVPDPNTFNRDIPREWEEKSRSMVADMMVDVDPNPIRCSVYFEGYTPDGHAAVGFAPGSERIVVLTGFSGHGFKISPAFGEIGAQLAIEGSAPLALPGLLPSREFTTENEIRNIAGQANMPETVSQR